MHASINRYIHSATSQHGLCTGCRQLLLPRWLRWRRPRRNNQRRKPLDNRIPHRLPYRCQDNGLWLGPRSRRDHPQPNAVSGRNVHRRRKHEPGLRLQQKGHPDDVHCSPEGRKRRHGREARHRYPVKGGCQVPHGHRGRGPEFAEREREWQRNEYEG